MLDSDATTMTNASRRSHDDVKVRDAFQDWPPRKWAADDPSGALQCDPRELRLLWFSEPDEDGWFSMTATDAQGASWSTYCRTSADVWRSLEQSLGRCLREPLRVLGDVELESAKRRP
jgi:hypothetical protein